MKHTKRPQSYFRKQRKRAIKRKLKILKFRRAPSHFQEICADTRIKGQLSKGKIHCSCPFCSQKSYRELKSRDKAHLENYHQQLREFRLRKDGD